MTKKRDRRDKNTIRVGHSKLKTNSIKNQGPKKKQRRKI